MLGFLGGAGINGYVGCMRMMRTNDADVRSAGVSCAQPLLISDRAVQGPKQRRCEPYQQGPLLGLPAGRYLLACMRPLVVLALEWMTCVVMSSVSDAIFGSADDHDMFGVSGPGW
jgi:hypothetical protein